MLNKIRPLEYKLLKFFDCFVLLLPRTISGTLTFNKYLLNE